MKGLVGIALMATLVTAALVLAVLAKLGALSRELEEVKKMVRENRGEGRTLDARRETLAVRTEDERHETVVENPSFVSSLKSSPQPAVCEPTAAGRFWSMVEEWFCVRGRFAPKGMTREFAVATRWLLRVGSLLLVGAMSYFITLAINRGWIGPAQRVYGMMFWGVVGTAAGTWLKVKSERYSILGEVFAALGLVATYLSFGLGHRYFKPPVIGSVAVAFAGLIAATVAAGVLSVRLKSLTIAVLGLVGGFLVPTICRFDDAYTQLEIYLLTLTIGASVVAYVRKWTALGFVAMAVAYGMVLGEDLSCFSTSAAITYVFHLAQYGMVLALTILGLRRHSKDANAYCWAFTTVAAIAWVVGGACGLHSWTTLKYHFLFAAVIHGALSVVSRRRNWGVAPVMMVLATLFAALTLARCCTEWKSWGDVAPLIFCAFAAILAELSVRAGERTLGVMAFLSAICCAGWFMALADAHYCVMSAYGAGFVSRVLDLWCAPVLMAFVGWRLCRKGEWLERLRVASYVISAVMGFIIVTAESKWFGELVLPSVGGGCITIVWAAIASAFLTAGIVRRWKAIRLCGLGLLGLSVFKVLFFDTASLAMPARVAVFSAVGVLMIVGAFLYLRFRNLFESQEGNGPSR